MKLDQNAQKAMFEFSSQLVTWALTIVAASVAAIVSTSNLSPQPLNWRWIYLLFAPGWVFLGCSIYFGELLGRRFIALLFQLGELNDAISSRMNDNFRWQRVFLGLGLVCFGLWLGAYLFWWVFKFNTIARG